VDGNFDCHRDRSGSAAGLSFVYPTHQRSLRNNWLVVCTALTKDLPPRAGRRPPGSLDLLTTSIGFCSQSFVTARMDVSHQLPLRHPTTHQAFNYISNKGYSRMTREDEKHWVDLLNVIHESVKGGMKVSTSKKLRRRPPWPAGNRSGTISKRIWVLFPVQHRGAVDGALSTHDGTNCGGKG
jgi:hypothetical protein